MSSAPEAPVRLEVRAVSSALLLAPREEGVASREEGELVEVDGLVAGAAVAVPTAEQRLQEGNRLWQCQVGRGAFGCCRSSVRKPCATVTSAVWWWKPR